MAADSRQQESSSSSDTSRRATFQDGDVFEQRRVRHITSILVRNVKVPSTSASSSALPRPRPRRSISTASSSSTSTIRRAPSNRSIHGNTRGRASSISSSYHGNGGINDDIYLQSDLTALRKEVESRLCRTFVSLSSVDNDQELYRSAASMRNGVNFEWGRAPGSISNVEGLHLDELGDSSAEQSVRVKIWYKRESISDKGKAREDDDASYVTPGTEAENGWSILSQQDVDLHLMSKLAEDPSTSVLSYSSNTILLGLSFPLGQVQLIEKDGEEEADRIKDKGIQERSKMVADRNKGEQVYYYISTDPKKSSISEETVPKASESKGEHRAAIQAKLKSGEIVRSYQIEDILRLLQMQREMCQQYLEVSTSLQRSNRILESNNGPIEKDFLCAEKIERLAVLRKERDRVQEDTRMKRKTVQERTEALNRRRARLEMARRAMTKEKASYSDLEEKLTQISRQCQMIRTKAYARRVLLLRQLEFIYPVDLVDGVNLLFSIVGVPLANRVTEDERVKATVENDDIVSSALGLIGQVVGLMSIYLDTPIHYPIATAGSRSIIQDSISVMSGPRIFPLYSKGVEVYRFEYAIFLLNKNIEQLMNNFGITVLDIRNTLPNLKNLIVTMSASSAPSSRLSRKNLIGSQTISLKGDTIETETVAASQLEEQLHHHQQLNSESRDEKVYRGGNTAWGMSLLGWGHSKANSSNHNQPSKSSASRDAPAIVPTVRSLGASK